MNTYDPDYIPCPNCGEDLGTEENVINLCQEPFNGVIESCAGCGNNISFDMKVQVTNLGGGKKPEEKGYFDFG